MKRRGLCMAATSLATAILCSGRPTDTSPSGNTTVGRQSNAARTGETVKKETDTGSEKETPAQDGGNRIISVSDYPIGYLQLANTGAYQIAETNSMKDEAGKRGSELIVTDTQDNTAKQIFDVENLIAQNIDLLMLSPRGFEGLETALQTAKGNSVPVILVDRPVKGEVGVDYVTYIATDFVWEGQVAGGWLKDKTGGTCNTIKFTGTVGSSSAQNKATGFADVMGQDEGMKIIISQTGDSEWPEGQRIMEGPLQAHRGEVNAVFCHNDQMALEAVQAIKAAGYRPNENTLVIGIDGEMDSFKSVIAGEMSTTVVSSPMYGPTTPDTVEKIFAGQEVPRQTIMEGVVVDAGNVQENIEPTY